MDKLLTLLLLTIVVLQAMAQQERVTRLSPINRKTGNYVPFHIVKDQTPPSEQFVDESHVPKTTHVHIGTRIEPMSVETLAKAVSELRRSDVKSAIAETPAVPQLSIAHQMPEAKVLVLYTGGTIGMKSVDGVYAPVAHYLPEAVRELPPLNDKAYVEAHYGNATVKPLCLPPVRHMHKRVLYWIIEYQPLLDSSDMTFDDWIRIARDISTAYDMFDGFVVLHGTDTMAYTSSVLSFMLENLRKPVIVTGAQIPICEVRSDGRDNFIASLIIAGELNIPEVTLYFDNKLLRGNRAIKYDNFGLNAFVSPNMQPLARMEIDVEVDYGLLWQPPTVAPFSLSDTLCRYVGILQIFPSIPLSTVRAFLRPPMQGVVLETYGAGNMPSRRTDILSEIQEAVQRGCIVINVSQCPKGQVDVTYLTGKVLYDVGAIPGADITPEAALTKLAYVLGKSDWDLAKKREMIKRNLRGEISEPM